MNSYSQNGEDLIAANYFSNHIGSFLSIGENDGKTLSNVYALRQLGWGGVLVEASPKAYGRLIETYSSDMKGITLFNVAIGSYDGKIILHESGEHLGQGDTGLVSTTREDQVQRWAASNTPFKDVEVDCWRFETLMAQSPLQTFDLLSIDIEGMEPEVVPQINFTALGIKMAIIEWNGQRADMYDGIMESQGFKLIHTNGENRIYAR